MIERERGPVKFEIIKHIGVLNTYPTGWSKEFNIVKWNDKSEKYDVRDWAPGHERMSRGITLYEDELEKLYGFCSGIFQSSESSDKAPEQQVPEQNYVQEQPASQQTADRVAEQPSAEVPF